MGTRRVQTNDSGMPEEDCTSLPFGGQSSCALVTNPPSTADYATPLHFTGKEHDTESGNDYFGVRYYASDTGRFLSPDYTGYGLDPAPVPWANFTNPQSLNLYSYVNDNPLSQADTDGHDCIDGGNLSQGTISYIRTSNPEDCGDGFTYVNGQINLKSLHYNSEAETLSYPFSKYADGSGSMGVGLISLPASYRDTLAYGLVHSPSAVSTWNNSSEGANFFWGGVVLAGTSAAVCVVLCGNGGPSRRRWPATAHCQKRWRAAKSLH